MLALKKLERYSGVSIYLHVLSALTLFFFSNTCIAADFYVSDCASGADSDCVAGNDSNSGASPAAAWRTFSRAHTSINSMAAGDTVHFARGGSFSVSGSPRTSNTNCRASNRCTVRDYTPPWASGDEGKPILRNSNGGIFQFTEGTPVADAGYRILNLDLRGGGAVGTGFSFSNDVSDVLIDNVDIDSFWIGIQNNGEKRIVLRNSRILNNPRHGWLGSGDNVLIENNYFENNGFSTNGGTTGHNHNLYYSGNGDRTSVGSRIVGNELYKSSFLPNPNNNGIPQCQGTSIVGHGNHSNLIIEDNIVREDPGTAAAGCWGIAIDGGYTVSERFDGLIIRRNKVLNFGGLAIGCQGCTNATIENNVIVDPAGTAIAVPDRLNRTGGAYQVDAATSDVTIRNNSIYISTDTSGTAIRLGTVEGSGFVLVNNAIHYTGNRSGWNCFDLGRPTSSYDAVDNNLCYFPNATSNTEWENGSGTSPNPLQAWRNSSPFGNASVNANPRFVAPNGPTFNLSVSNANSPLVNAGHASRSSNNDFLENVRDANPDIGAFEFGGSVPDSVPPAAPRGMQIQ